MPPIPGKSCGPCTMCCKVLEIVEMQKPAGPFCPQCIRTGGCAIYAARPRVCRDYECDWLRERALGPRLRPDRTGTILMEDADSDEYRAVCDPERPMDWLDPLVFRHLVALAKKGRRVVAKAGLKTWRIHPSGRYSPST